LSEGYIIFASQREYVANEFALFTCGPVGAETGKYFQDIFGDMYVIGRATTKNNLDIGKTTPIQFKRFQLVTFRLRSKHVVADFLRAIFILWPIIKGCKGAVVRCGGVGTLVGIICLIQRKPLGLEIGGCVFNSLWNYGGIFGKIYAPVSYLLRRFLIKHANRVQFVTQKYLQDRYLGSTSNIKTIGISNVNIKNVRNAENQVRKFQNKKIVISTIGSFSGNFKGHDLAVRFIARLAENGFDVELRILGTGDQRSIEALAEKLGVASRVRLYPAVQPVEVKQWLLDSTVYIQFSRREGISRATLEAMSCAIPVLGSNVGGTSEIVSARYLYDVGDLDTLEIKFRNLISDRHLYQQACEQSVFVASKFVSGRLKTIRKEFWAGFPEF